MKYCKFVGIAAILILATTPLVLSQPARPPQADRYRVLLRYSIIAPRDPHVIMYDALIRHLQGLDFQFTPPLEEHPDSDREDPTKNTLEGIIAASKIRDILRNPHVTSLLIMPTNVKLPDGDQPIGVQLDLIDSLSMSGQRQLGNQVRVLLAEMGFQEATGYDHRGVRGRPFSRLVGVLPAGNLLNLLKDLRRQPSDWLSPKYNPEDLPTPLRSASPILMTEVLPYLPAVGEPAPPAPRKPPFLEKVSTGLWAHLQQKEKDAGLIRYQAILAKAPSSTDSSWRHLLNQSAPSFFIEGQLGPVVTGTGPPFDIARLAALPQVSFVRLPPPLLLDVATAGADSDNDKALRLTGLDKLHEKHRGKGVRLAIVDTDFRGWESARKDGKLPKTTTLVDLTTERNPDIRAAAFAGDPEQLGHGTQCAIATALAAPDAKLVLMRIVAVAPVNLQEVVKHIRGDYLSEHLARRRDELIADRARLLHDRGEVLRERKLVLESFEDDRDLERDFSFLGPAYGWVFSNREWMRQRMQYQEEAERQFVEREKRYFELLVEIRSLKDIPLVACPLGWNDGYPLGGASALSRWLEELQAPRPLWFQSVGNNDGQSWTGLFRDQDHNGVMEFVPPGAALPKGHWTAELNFLGWSPHRGKPGPDLPDKAHLRISLQWREPHDPDYQPRPGEPDHFLLPLTPLRLVLVRQRDPQGKKLPADDLQVVAYSAGVPQRLVNQPSYAVYEIDMPYAVEQPGRYAVRVERMLDTRWVPANDPVTGRPVLLQLEGLVPTGTRPLGAASLPAFEKSWELRPRIFVDVLDEASRLVGRPVFLDYATALGTIGVPADSRGVVSVGAADFNNQREPYSSPGPPADMELAKIPNILAYDRLTLAPEGTPGPYGSSVSTCFAAGIAACLMSSGMSAERVEQYLGKKSGKVTCVP